MQMCTRSKCLVTGFAHWENGHVSGISSIGVGDARDLSISDSYGGAGFLAKASSSTTASSPSTCTKVVSVGADYTSGVTTLCLLVFYNFSDGKYASFDSSVYKTMHLTVNFVHTYRREPVQCQ